MNFSFENYWKSIYRSRSGKNYETQSVQSKEIINWHKNYIEKFISNQFGEYKPRVLDIGCCSGYLTNLFCDFSSEVVGVDYNEGFISNAKSNYSNPKFVKADIYNLQKIDGLFDLIVCFGVLQNISDLELALKSIKSKLSNRIQSKVVFTTINQNSILDRIQFVKRLTHPHEKQDYNLNVFSKDQFYKLSKLTGLKLTKFDYMYVFPSYINPFHFIARTFLPSSFSHHILVEMQHV
jgi:2-polyprenyl-3-methyl-5-hydroxy-6-metoxy-1,4-benzoquinol methylase